MDNRVFNVNGKGEYWLLEALKLAFAQKAGFYNRDKPYTCNGFMFDQKKGLILLWTDCNGSSKFPVPLTAEAVAPIVWQWLQSEEAKLVELDGWDKDADHDGSNSYGWRVYCEDWGHVANKWQAIVAVTPAYMWHGK